MRCLFQHRLLVPILAAALVSLTVIASTATDAGANKDEGRVLTGVFTATAIPVHSGSGYVAGCDDSPGQIAITPKGGAEGLVDVAAVYRSPFGSRQTRLLLDSAFSNALVLRGGGTFSSVPAGRLPVRPDDRTVILQSNGGDHEIGTLRLTSASAPPHQVGSGPVHTNATAEARSPMGYLADHYGRGMLFGQQDMASIQWLETSVGAAPAIAGLDMTDRSPSQVERDATSAALEEAFVWEKRDRTTVFVWHWNTPTGPIDHIDQPGREWWRSFCTSVTTLDAVAAVADPEGYSYGLLLSDIDAVAVRLKHLQEAGVPMLWCPARGRGRLAWRGAKGAVPVGHTRPGSRPQIWDCNHLFPRACRLP